MSLLADRRIFLAQLGKGALAVAVLGVSAAACDGDGGTQPRPTSTTGGGPASTATGAQDTPTTSSSSPSTPPPTTAGSLLWERVNLGFVSAYLVIRAGESAIVDTGVSGSAPAIEQALAAAGVGWDSVGHVVFTHAHRDHIGSATEVLGSAPAATAYAGAGDIPAISAPTEVTAVGDGDSVFGLDVIATPGHTPGHICLHDRIGGLLIAGDALNGDAGGVAGPNPQFSSDMVEANRSVVKLAGLTFEAVVFGHGEPVLDGADAQVRSLANSL